MAVRDPDFRVETPSVTVRADGTTGPEPSLGELFGRLSEDARRLIRQEVALAKVEFRETGTMLARDGRNLALAAGLGLAGMLAATAFLILALGDLIDNYWLSALIVSALYLAMAAIVGKGALNDVKRHGMKPDETLDTLREDVTWAKEQAGEVKREWTS